MLLVLVSWLWLGKLGWLWLGKLGLRLFLRMLLDPARACDCPPLPDEQDEVLITERVEAHKVNCFEKWEAACAVLGGMVLGRIQA